MRIALAVVAVLIGVSACESSQSGTPIASKGSGETSPSSAKPTKSSEPTSDLPAYGAPKVSSPLKTDKFETDPCSVFTQEKLREYGVGQGEVNTDEGGKVCTWETDDAGAIDLGWDTLKPRGITRFYQGNKNKDYAFFDVLPDIEGFPAVSYSTKDYRRDGICTVAVGVADNRMFMVSLALSKSKRQTHDPCGVAATVATDAATSMKAGA
ncbi:DUF3558 domain-containing protein [Actinokineospora alba]|nr:DUF3558 domain-containing protein [Actinokineospora alba]